MIRHRPARSLKLAVLSCVLLSCLTTLQTPASAIAIYEGFVHASMSTGTLPAGTSFFLLPGFITGDQGHAEFSGNALAAATGSVSTPGSVTALVTGFAAGPGVSHAQSNVNAEAQATIVNQNATMVPFPLTFSHSRGTSASTFPFGGQIEEAAAVSSIAASLDGTRLFTNVSFPCFFAPESPVAHNCNSFDSGSQAFVFGLTPGSHSLSLFLELGGEANSSPTSPVPEPATLLLFSTSMAGVAFAVRRRRRAQK